jgi:hypothetical protein
MTMGEGGQSEGEREGRGTIRSGVVQSLSPGSGRGGWDYPIRQRRAAGRRPGNAHQMGSEKKNKEELLAEDAKGVGR